MPDRPVFMHEVNRLLYDYANLTPMEARLSVMRWEKRRKIMPTSDKFVVHIMKEEGPSCTFDNLSNYQAQFLKDIIASGKKVHTMEILQVVYHMAELTEPEEPTGPYVDP